MKLLRNYFARTKNNHFSDEQMASAGENNTEAVAPTQVMPTPQNPTYLSASAGVLLFLYLLLPQFFFLLLLGGAGGLALCEKYQEQVVPKVTAAKSRLGVEIRSVVQQAKSAAKSVSPKSDEVEKNRDL